MRVIVGLMQMNTTMNIKTDMDYFEEACDSAMRLSASRAEQVILNAVASARMEGLAPTEEDIELIRRFLNKEISKDQFIQTIINDVKENDYDTER